MLHESILRKQSIHQRIFITSLAITAAVSMTGSMKTAPEAIMLESSDKLQEQHIPPSAAAEVNTVVKPSKRLRMSGPVASIRQRCTTRSLPSPLLLGGLLPRPCESSRNQAGTEHIPIIQHVI